MPSTAPVKVQAPDSSDKEGIEALPEGAGNKILAGALDRPIDLRASWMAD